MRYFIDYKVNKWAIINPFQSLYQIQTICLFDLRAQALRIKDHNRNLQLT